MKMDGRMKNEGTNEGLVLDRLQKETRRWRQPRDPERCPCAVFWALKDLAPTRRERARDMRAITRHVSSICIQEDLLSGARWRERARQRWSDEGMHDTDSLPRLARSGTRCRRSTSLVEPTANEQIHVSTHFRHQEDCISFASKMRGQVRHVHLGRHQGHFICPRENKVALKSARPFSIALLLLPCFRHTASVYSRIAD